MFSILNDMYDEYGVPYYVYDVGNCTADSAKGQLLRNIYKEGFEPEVMHILLDANNRALLVKILEEEETCT